MSHVLPMLLPAFPLSPAPLATFSLSSSTTTESQEALRGGSVVKGRVSLERGSSLLLLRLFLSIVARASPSGSFVRPHSVSRSWFSPCIT